ncbi:hypothetical protein [Lysobacter terrae]
MTKFKNIPIVVALMHVLLFFTTVLYVSKSHDPQAPLIWGIWAVVDFPVSLLYFVAGKAYSDLLHSVSNSYGSLAWLFYMPHWIHGLLGTLWWYLLSRFFINFRKRKAA